MAAAVKADPASTEGVEGKGTGSGEEHSSDSSGDEEDEAPHAVPRSVAYHSWRRLLKEEGLEAVPREDLLQQHVLRGVRKLRAGQEIVARGEQLKASALQDLEAALALAPTPTFSAFLRDFGQVYTTEAGMDVDPTPSTSQAMPGPSGVKRKRASAETNVIIPQTPVEGAIPKEYTPSAIKIDGKDKYRCVRCDFPKGGEVTSCRETVCTHVREVHLNIAMGCPVCNKQYHNMQAYRAHVKKHAPAEQSA